MSPLRLAILALAAFSATDAAHVAPSLHRLRGGATVTTVKAPGETYQALASAGVAKATMPMNKALHSAFMGGWYVAIGGVFALVVAGALVVVVARARRRLLLPRRKLRSRRRRRTTASRRCSRRAASSSGRRRTCKTSGKQKLHAS